MVCLIASFAYAHGGEHHESGIAPTISVAVTFDAVAKKGESVTGRLTITVPKEWHIYAHGAPEEFVAVSVEETTHVIDRFHAAWPPAGEVTFDGIAMPVYEGRVVVPLAGIMTVGPPADWKGTVTYQACGADLCLPPETREVVGKFVE